MQSQPRPPWLPQGALETGESFGSIAHDDRVWSLQWVLPPQRAVTPSQAAPFSKLSASYTPGTGRKGAWSRTMGYTEGEQPGLQHLSLWLQAQLQEEDIVSNNALYFFTK